MEIKVLGSVAPYPKGNLNCSSFLVKDEKKSIMLDAGFGCSRDLDLLHDLKNLTIIISHYHPDHYGDLLAIKNQTYIAKKLGYLDKEVDVYLPEAICGTNICGSWKPPIIFPSKPLAYDFLRNEDVNFVNFHTYNKNSEITIDDMHIRFSKNPHDIDTYAAKIISDDGVELVYSSDTGFKNNTLEEFAKNSSALICEATYLLGQDKGKNDFHLYAQEAGIIAEKANVEKLFLFHTFPEIDKEKYVEEAKRVFSNTESVNEGEIIKLERRI